MNKQKADVQLIRWFYQLPQTVRYRFASQWMVDEAAGISNAKLAEWLVGETNQSETLVKSFRSFDLKKQQLKNVWRPDSGFNDSHVHSICSGINAYRDKNGRDDEVSVEAFYQRAWDELAQQYPLKDEIADGSDELRAKVTTKLSGLSESESPAVEPQSVDLSKKDAALQLSLVARLKILALVLVIGVIGYVFWQKNQSSVGQTTYRQYLPGNVVQVRQLNQLGLPIMLEYPEHYLDAQRCYPNLTIAREPSTISSQRQLQGMPLTGLDHMTHFMPDLTAKQHLLHSITIGFDGVERWHVAKGQINLGMSDVCLSSLQQVIDYGNKIDDYSIIKQTYIAQRLDVILKFSDDTNLHAIEDVITRVAGHYSAYDVEVVKTQNQQTITRQLTVNGPVAVGYISQPMSARMSR